MYLLMLGTGLVQRLGSMLSSIYLTLEAVSKDVNDYQFGFPSIHPLLSWITSNLKVFNPANVKQAGRSPSSSISFQLDVLALLRHGAL